MQALLESQWVVDVVGEHHLTGRMQDYPLIVVAECDYLEPAFKQELVEYVRDGGHLLIVGPRAASHFADELGVSLGSAQQEPRYLACDDRLCATRDVTQTPVLGPEARPHGQLHVADDLGSASHPAASVTSLGQGKIAATYFSFSRGYLATRSSEARAFLSDLVRQLFRNPLVEVKGSSCVDVSLSRLDGKLVIHLVNTSGAHWDQENPLFDSIEPVGPLDIAIRGQRGSARVTLEPGAEPVSFEYRAGRTHLTVPSLDVHRAIVIQ